MATPIFGTAIYTDPGKVGMDQSVAAQHRLDYVDHRHLDSDLVKTKKEKEVPGL